MASEYEIIERFVFEKMKESGIPGMSIALIKDGKVVYSKGFGFRDVEYGKPATPETIYGIGSVTKSFTALAIMKLVEMGKLSVDDPVDKYVGINIRPKGEKIKIWHLLTHSSGIPALGYAEALIDAIAYGEGLITPIASPEDVISFMTDAEKWAVSKPGERFFYLNEGYVLLGKIISVVSGMSYEDFVRKYILMPLNMKRTYFRREEVQNDPNVATPYVYKDGKLEKGAFPYGITADGGILSNVMDLSRYVLMYLNEGSLDGYEVISKEYIKEMTEPRIKLPYELFGDEFYGYGLSIYPRFPIGTLIGHSGSVLVYTAYMGFIPKKKIGVILLANASGYPLSQMGMYALMALAGENPEKLPFVRYERTLKELEGVYRAYKSTIMFKVKVEGGFLVLESRRRYSGMNMILVPEIVEDERVLCYTLQYGRKIYAEFIKRGDHIELIYERYKLIKE
ncbi:MAG: serine hydrolase [Thermoplasmata archaeon]|nr:MAG: serine hydrolase [Thermoplasmata archaeon]